jgi:hypothetical protein
MKEIIYDFGGFNQKLFYVIQSVGARFSGSKSL